jgi:hypothetical protein
MNALAGIVSLLKETVLMESQYLAGIWSHSLWEDLLWHTETTHWPEDLEPEPVVNIPSWSWMSAHLGYIRIEYAGLGLHRPFPRLKTVKYEPENEQLPFGHVAPGAYLVIEGQLTPARIMPLPYYFEISGLFRLGWQIAFNVFYDFHCRPKLWTGEPVWLLRVAYLRDGLDIKEAFLILRPISIFSTGTNAQVPSFTRIGYLEILRRESLAILLEGLPIEEGYQLLRLY